MRREFARSWTGRGVRFDPVRGFALSLRAKLGELYGTTSCPGRPIPAHLLAICGPELDNIYDVVAPENDNAVMTYRHSPTPAWMPLHGQDRRSVFQFSRFCAVARDFLGAIIVVKPLIGRGVPRFAWDIDEVEDCASRCASTSMRKLQDHSSRAASQLLPTCLQQRVLLYRPVPMTVSMKLLAIPCRCRSRPVPVQIGLLDAERTLRDIGLLLKQRWPRSLSFRLADGRPMALESLCRKLALRLQKLWWQLREQYQGVSAPNDADRRVRPERNTTCRQYALFAVFPGAHFAVPVLTALCEIAGEKAHPSMLHLQQQTSRRAIECHAGDGAQSTWPVALESLMARAIWMPAHY